ncbi:MAG: PorP/SprF family type IX secretion system membrane protein [Bacteroidia bacterium]
MEQIKYKILFLILFIAGRTGYAQQDPMYSMYMLDKMLINPGYTGSSNWAVGTLKYRQQFIGIEGAPVTETFNFHAPIQKKHIGLGFKVINDKIAINSNLNASLFYSYHLNFAGGKLSAGIEAGIYNRRIDYSKLILNNTLDNSLSRASVNSIVPDGSAGIYYQKKQFYAGVSDCHLIGMNFATASKAHLYNHIYLIMGKVFELSDKWALEPSVLVKYQQAAPVQIDLNASVTYNDIITIGAQYRSGDAVGGFVKVSLMENLRIAYAFDKTMSGLSPFSKGAHEIIISYGIKLPPPSSEKEVHPRYYF